ncbi:nucleoside triphosphate hydrolase protein [Wolfiporia cocos MD-104 SS10]|uniref:Nucleoside triphosphate hydrolase protein n=1 Tax=Wolfiporia cocos (strain MD-104) TaxID=742152 RepID=A0A2H3JGH5_WOLCO|nr:nucleoside triphosphate hydrolase protein [Wolfiporia cocos MD-104 SS10]
MHKASGKQANTEASLGSVLEVKHLHEVYDRSEDKYVIKPAPLYDTSPGNKRDGQKEYTSHAFTVIRRFARGQPDSSYNFSTLLQINSQHLVDVCKEVIGPFPEISWTAKPLRISPQTFLSWLPFLKAHKATLADEINTQDTADDSPIHLRLAHLNHLLSYLTTTHEETLAILTSLLEHGEISFDLLWALYVPGKTVLYMHCPVTGEPRCVRLVNAELRTSMDSSQYWRLTVEYIEADIVGSGYKQKTTAGFGLAELNTMLRIHSFPGAKNISSIPAYPIQYYEGADGIGGLKERLIQRGKKWAAIAGGVHHLAYQGIAFEFESDRRGEYVKHSINSRVMIDRKTFAETVPNYGQLPHVTKTLSGRIIDRHSRRARQYGAKKDKNVEDIRELTDEELLLATPIVYGFSLSDKQWLEFSVDLVTPFQWNDEALSRLVIPSQHKTILRTILESYTSNVVSTFDDFIIGKGLGLVINLYGSPGIGKSLTAEAMSEGACVPLYIVGAADLGTNAESLDRNLTRVFKVAAAWGAVCLIDEADVFLEERSLQFIERNAMVAVFLRQLELAIHVYFRGILLLTTNRVRVFDEALQSRIHISIRYGDLTPEARRQIWLAFLHKVNGDVRNGGVTEEELAELGEKDVNGRQIKNVVKTAGALAVGGREKLGMKHLVQILDLMEEFDTRYDGSSFTGSCDLSTFASLATKSAAEHLSRKQDD